MKFFRCGLLCLLLPACVWAAAPAVTPGWNRVLAGPIKTSIYVGSVTLTTQPFVRDELTLVSTYAAKVFPWIFWNETGDIAITLSPAELAKLERGERCAFTGEAQNHKGKPRHVTGHADPTGPDTGKIKVRIGAGDVELIFNGTYTLAVAGRLAGDTQASSAQ